MDWARSQVFSGPGLSHLLEGHLQGAAVARDAAAAVHPQKPLQHAARLLRGVQQQQGALVGPHRLEDSGAVE